MSNKWQWIITDTNRAGLLRLISDALTSAPVGFILAIAEPTRSREQENKFHAMIRDISRQCTFMEREWDFDSWKRLLIDAFVAVKREEAHARGEEDPFEGQGSAAPSLDGQRIVQLGVQSRTFSRAMASEFIEYLHAYGAENGVTWSKPALTIIEEMRKERHANKS